MILLNGPNTPFGRMALASAIELGIALENRVIDVGSAEFLDDLNPLRQIPTLILDDGGAVFDSRVICAYFASRVPGQTLLPDDIAMATRWSMIVGLMDAAVGWRMEQVRPPGERSPAASRMFERRVTRTIATLESLGENICQEAVRIDAIATAVALDYIAFRHGDGWQAVAPRLAAWLPTFLERPSMAATLPY